PLPLPPQAGGEGELALAVVTGGGAAQLLDRGAPRLGLQAPALGRSTGSGGPARGRRRDGAAGQLGPSIQRIPAAALLRAVARGGDDEDAVAGQPAAREPLGALAHSGRQRGRMAQVETQLHRRRHLVDILAARAGGANKTLLDLAFVEQDRPGYRKH